MGAVKNGDDLDFHTVKAVNDALPLKLDFSKPRIVVVVNDRPELREITKPSRVFS
jgi:hypothetical protein